MRTILYNKQTSPLSRRVIGLVASIFLLFSITACSDAPEQAATTTLGAILPLTGPVGSYGERARKGIDFAIRELGEQGSVAISMVYEDDQDKTQLAVAALQKLANIEKVPAILGSASSGVTLALAGPANQRKIVLLSPIASSPELTTKGGAFFFRVAPADDAQAKSMAEWLLAEGHRKVAVLYMATSWGQSLFEAVSKHLQAGGGEVIASDSVQVGESDFRIQIGKFKQAEPDVFYVATHGKEGGAFVKQARAMGVSVPFYGADVWSSPEFISVGGKATEGCRLIAPAKPAGSAFDGFAERFEAVHGEAPDVYAAYSYDAAMILAKAVADGAKTGEEIRKWLSTMEPHAGVSGPVSFDENGDVVGRSFDRFEIQGGKLSLVEQ
uniref:Branched-chain amino acid transport system substrate-binding protein n=1 Tax=Candidatus Kentrum sp. TC TaxID=2126339 RepID=A0A450YVJ7_9GAMM|nr:MAG: branched-chain amino acid transport system substrate-binding protein [Candidatus Kentron sp. TC]